MRRRAYIHTPGRLRHDEQFGTGVNLAPNDVLLQIAAGERARDGGRTGGLHIEATDDSPGMTFQLLDTDPAPGKSRMRNRLAACQQQVVRERQRRHGAASEPLLGNKMQAKLAPCFRTQTRGIDFADPNRSRWRAHVLTRQSVEQLLLPVARNARNAHHLARMNFERDLMKIHAELVLARQRQRTHTQHRRTQLRLAPRQLRWLGTNHQARQGGIGLLRRLANSGHPAAAQHGADAAQLADFMQLVADVQNAAARAGHLSEHHKEFLHGLRHQHRRRLVKNQQLRLRQQGADDFNALHLPHAQRVHRTRRVNIEPVLGRFGTDALRHFGQTQSPVQTQPDVLGHGDGAKQAEVLKHHGNTQSPRLLRVADLHRLTVEHHAASVGLDRAVDDLHQGRLTGAVFAQNCMDFTRHDAHRHRVIRPHAGVALADVSKLEARCRHAVGGLALALSISARSSA